MSEHPPERSATKEDIGDLTYFHLLEQLLLHSPVNPTLVRGCLRIFGAELTDSGIG
jgi:hypothetical protein